MKVKMHFSLVNDDGVVHDGEMVREVEELDAVVLLHTLINFLFGLHEEWGDFSLTFVRIEGWGPD